MNDITKPKHPSKRSDVLITPFDQPWRVAFPFVHKKRTMRATGAPVITPHFDVCVMAPKLHQDGAQCANYQKLQGMLMQAATRAWGSWPEGGHWPIQNGDDPIKPKAPAPGQPAAPVDPNKYAWRRGYWIFDATNYTEVGPKVAILKNGAKEEIPAQAIGGRNLYKSGDYAVLSIQAYTFHNEKWGVNFGFDGICFVAEGEAIGSGAGPKSVEDMFAGVQAPVGLPAMGSTAAPPVAAPGGPAPALPPAQPAAPVYAAPQPQPPVAPSYAAPQPPQTYTAPMAPPAGLPPFPGPR